MLPPLAGLALAAAGLAVVLAGVRLMLHTSSGSSGIASWTMLPGIARGIRAWVRPRRPVLPVSFRSPRVDDEDEGTGPTETSGDTDDAADPTPTARLSGKVGLRG